MYYFLVQILEKNFKIKNRYIKTFLCYFIVSFIGIFLSLYISSSYNGLCPSIFALLLSMIPLVQLSLSMIYEEKELLLINKKNIFLKYGYFIISYFGILVGTVLAYFIGYLFFPKYLFMSQELAILDIAKSVNFLYTGNFTKKDVFFGYIFNNNLKVLLLVFFLSYIYGAGGIYIITWNASILGVFLAKKFLEGSLLNSLLLLLPHGILEFLAYLISALSGTIFSLYILFPDKLSKKELKDAFILFISSVIILFIAAIIEAYF